MSTDFVALKQLTVPVNSSTSTPITIPTDIKGYPAGQPLIVKVVSDVKVVFKVGSTSDAADKTVASNALVDGNIFAYPNAIETYKVTSLSSNSTATNIHSIGYTTSGNIDFCFGYYL